MKKQIIKKAFLSIAACAVVLSLQGCGEDRAGDLGDANNTKNNLGNTGTEDKPTVLGVKNKTPDDSDGDGIPDKKEREGYKNPGIPGVGDTITTNPDKWDTDGDGISDGCEIYMDKEHCGITPKYNKPTNPNNPDTDGDGIKDGDELLEGIGDGPITDPRDPDTDHDGLSDGDEINAPGAPQNLVKVKTDPTNPDSDDDGLSDGVEVESKIKTDPLNADTDGDGVTDGIEVCGTNDPNTGYGNGKVTSTNADIEIKDGATFYTDKLATLVNHYDGSTTCANPADYNQDGTIDAKDPNNDSDGDERPNKAEKDKNTDPLNSGKDYDKTTITPDVNDSIENRYYYPWITQTPDGKKMTDANFVYVPKDDSKGFWMAKYLAVYTNDEENSVKFVKGDDKVDNISLSDAKKLVENSENDLKIDRNISLPTKTQYLDLLKAKDSINSDCLKIKNKVGDANMPISYNETICELIPTSDNSVNQEFKKDGTVYIYSKANITDDSSSEPNQNTHFRAATDYLNSK